MPRKPRIDAPGAIQHVVAKGCAGEYVVRDDIDYDCLLRGIGDVSVRQRWVCLAYCLLNTHLHLVVGTPSGSLGTGMQRLLSRYAVEFNKRHEREGNLFHTRFYSKPIRSDEHLISSIVYVLLNPVRAGLASGPELWKWSSYRATLGIAAPPPFLATHATLELMDDDAERARVRLKLALAESRAADRRPRGVREGV